MKINQRDIVLTLSGDYCFVVRFCTKNCKTLSLTTKAKYLMLQANESCWSHCSLCCFFNHPETFWPKNESQIVLYKSRWIELAVHSPWCFADTKYSKAFCLLWTDYLKSSPQQFQSEIAQIERKESNVWMVGWFNHWVVLFSILLYTYLTSVWFVEPIGDLLLVCQHVVTHLLWKAVVATGFHFPCQTEIYQRQHLQEKYN